LFGIAVLVVNRSTGASNGTLPGVVHDSAAIWAFT
jgi:hypothetical protein